MGGMAVVKRSGRSLLEVAGVCGLAVTQPLLADFGAAPDWFVFHGVPASTIVAFGLAVALVPPIAVWAATELVGLGREGRRRLAVSVAVGALVGLLVVQLAGPVVALVAAPLAGWAHARWAGVRLWAAWLSPAPLLFLVVFLTQSPVSALVQGQDVDPADLGAFGSGDPPPVVVLVFDEWPLASIVHQDGSLDAQRYPNLARLAGASTWYRNTTTVANLTNFAVPAILTGNDPEDGEGADASSHPENLFTLLGGTYRLDVTERITRLCPTSLCEGDSGGAGRETDYGLADLVGEATDLYTDRLTGDDEAPVTDVFVEPEAAVDQARADEGSEVLDDLLEPRPETLSRFLRDIRPDEPPTLHFLHLLAPHTPYRHLDDGHQYEADPAVRAIGEDDVRSGAAPPAELDRLRLQQEVTHVDRLVGDVLDRLERTGLFDDALLVVTSDHGIAFQPGFAARGLNESPIDVAMQPELLWVPLFVKAPGQTTGEVVDAPAETIDVLPTMAADLGIELPWDVDGVDLTGPVDADRRRRFRHVVGSSFATFTLDPPAPVEADVTDVFALGVDSVPPWPAEDGPPGEQLAATFDDLTPFQDVDLRQPVVPAVVSGRVDPGVTSVAVVVNGRVAQVVETYDGGRFAALVSPALLRDDANEVTVSRP
jgi:hypothetical protein